ncbi:hypothetical protein D3C72_2583500 [compost metagenome]
MEVFYVFNSCVIGTLTFTTQIEFKFGYKSVVNLVDRNVAYIVFPGKEVFGVFQ